MSAVSWNSYRSLILFYTSRSVSFISMLLSDLCIILLHQSRRVSQFTIRHLCILLAYFVLAILSCSSFANNFYDFLVLLFILCQISLALPLGKQQSGDDNAREIDDCCYFVFAFAHSLLNSILRQINTNSNRAIKK